MNAHGVPYTASLSIQRECGIQEDINFADCCISAESFECLSQAVSSWHHLTVLDLGLADQYDNDSFSAQPLAESLAHHTSLQYLSLNERRFKGRVASVLLPPLAMHHKGLRHLDLGVLEEGFEQQIYPGISGLSELTNLTLLSLPQVVRPVDVAFPGAELASALSHLCDLQDLNISNSAWGSSIEVVGSLSTLTRLTNLYLVLARIDSSTAPQLAHSLRCLLMLQELDMDFNNLGGSGCQLARALSDITSLRHVSLSHTELEQGEAVDCIEALEEHPYLTKLVLHGSVSAAEYYIDDRDDTGRLVYEVEAVFCKTWVFLDPPDPVF